MKRRTITYALLLAAVLPLASCRTRKMVRDERAEVRSEVTSLAADSSVVEYSADTLAASEEVVVVESWEYGDTIPQAPTADVPRPALPPRQTSYKRVVVRRKTAGSVRVAGKAAETRREARAERADSVRTATAAETEKSKGASRKGWRFPWWLLVLVAVGVMIFIYEKERREWRR